MKPEENGKEERLRPSSNRKMRTPWAFLFLLALPALRLLPGCDGSDPFVPPPPPPPGEGGYTINPEALWKTGVVREDAQGNPLEWMLHSCRRATPLAVPGSRLLEIDDHSLPLGLAVHPSGGYVFLTTAGRGSKGLLVIDAAGGDILHRIDTSGYFLGLAFRPPDGREVYVSGGGRDVIETYGFDPETGALARQPERDMALPGFASGLAVTPDGTVLLAVSQLTGHLTAFDLETARELGRAKTGTNPYTVAVHPGGREAYVSCEGANAVDVIDVSDPADMRRTAVLQTQKNPEALCVNQAGDRLYVTNADEDSLTVFQVGSGEPRALQQVDLRSTPGMQYGSSPNALAFSADGRRLYIAQARLHQLAVIDTATGAHLGDIPTGAYPTAVAIHASSPGEGPAAETLFVANGKGIGTPGPGDERLVPGRLSILPVPGDDQLEGLTSLAAENNAFPSRLFDLTPGAWRYPVPRERGGPTPIKHVFLVIKENKTYDYVLGAYQPAQGYAEGDPDRVMPDHDKLLPNLYKLAGRFAVCDNYYSNAEASNQGHELLTSSTVNTYVEKLVFSDGRPVPFELEMIFNPAAWPKKDYIFQQAIREGIRFRDYGEAVGMGKDLLLLNPEYVHFSLVDPPWYNMYSKDEDKMLDRIEEWESPEFSGPNFPQLIVMLLPNDHTFGGDAGMPTPQSMIADNDLAMGMFVDWLSKSPYWNESVAFITEDDPQNGSDHIDSLRTFLLVVSPWVKRGYVSHVRYNEAHLYATMEYLLGMSPLTLFDEVAQPLYDLFDFRTDPEPYDLEPKQWPWEYNPAGTEAARRSAGMYFAEPDEAEGLQELMLEMDAERREAGGLGRRTKEGLVRLWRTLKREQLPGPDPARGAGPGDPPDAVLDLLLDRARAGDAEGFRALLDSGVPDLERLVRSRTEALRATGMAPDPVRMVLEQFAQLEPRPVSQRVEGDAAAVDVVYRDGIPAELWFVREPGGWRFDLSRHLGPAVKHMGETCVIRDAFLAAAALEGGGPRQEGVLP